MDVYNISKKSRLSYRSWITNNLNDMYQMLMKLSDRCVEASDLWSDRSIVRTMITWLECDSHEVSQPLAQAARI